MSTPEFKALQEMNEGIFGDKGNRYVLASQDFEHNHKIVDTFKVEHAAYSMASHKESKLQKANERKRKAENKWRRKKNNTTKPGKMPKYTERGVDFSVKEYNVFDLQNPNYNVNMFKNWKDFYPSGKKPLFSRN